MEAILGERSGGARHRPPRPSARGKERRTATKVTLRRIPVFQGTIERLIAPANFSARAWSA
jgi:hypothetical protein